MLMKVIGYHQAHDIEWDDFVLNQSANGTIFHTRNFLNYHPSNRFDDQSILIYDESRIIAVIAVAKTKKGYFSHPGTSGGGPIIHKKYFKMKKIIFILDKILEYYRDRLSLRLMESYFTNYSNEPILFYLYHKYRIYPELSVYKKLDFEDKFLSVNHPQSRNSIRKLHSEGFIFTPTDKIEDYELFYTLLNSNLSKYNVKPIHSFNEIMRLKGLLSKDQLLFVAKNHEGTIVAATWIIKATKKAWHMQYYVKDYSFNFRGLVEGLIIECADYAKDCGAEILSFGISTENKGRYLNLSLISFKEELNVSYQNRYLLEVKNDNTI